MCVDPKAASRMIRSAIVHDPSQIDGFKDDLKVRSDAQFAKLIGMPMRKLIRSRRLLAKA